MKKFVLVLLAMLTLSLTVMAKPVDSGTARKAATTFLKGVGGNSLTDLTDVTSQSPFKEFYIFSLNQGKGFILVSADDCVMPILGYSLSNTFVTEQIPAHVKDWMQMYDEQIAFYREHYGQQEFGGSPDVREQWDGLLNGQMPDPPLSTSVNALVTTTWNQSPYYNDLCPYDNTYSTKTVTGCVATATAQVMKFWNHPTTGYGSHSYSLNTYGTQSANFGATTYDWANMPTSLTSSSSATQVNAVATLMYHIGVAVEMDYGPGATGGSSAITGVGGDLSQAAANNALITYFKYKPTLHFELKENYTDAQWSTMLRNELDAGRPMVYKGRDYSGGHAFVCDGYNAQGQFHFNWGWGGSYDGFYTMGDLHPGTGGTGGNSTYTFNLANGAIMGIEPISNWDTTASTTVSVSTSQSNNGSVTGSGSYNFGQTITLRANANTGCRLNQWSDGSIQNPRQLIARGGAINLTADIAALSGDTLGYCFSGRQNSLGNGSGGNYWGIKMPGSVVTSGHKLTAVQFYVSDSGTYDVTIYTGTSSPSTAIHTQTFVVTDEDCWTTLALSAPVTIPADQNFWITLHDNGIAYPASYSSSCGNGDGALWGSSFSSISSSWDISFMIRGIFSESINTDTPANGTLTVYNDATGYNEYVPFYGYYADETQQNQMIYPATELSALTGKEITQMVFYIDHVSGSNNIGNWIVSLGETTDTSLSGLDNTTTLTQVYSGAMTFDGDTLMTVTFTNGYIYQGGNLLVEFNHPVAASYKHYYFTGQTVTGASYCYSSQRNFLPKVTFSYETPASCTKPSGLAATLTPGNGTIATLNWTAGGTETAWVLEYGTASDFTGATSVNVSGTPAANLTGLTAEQTYYARVKAICSATDESNWCSIPCVFTPTNALTITINDGTNTNQYVPIYGYYCDDNTHSKFIIPASTLSSITWDTITKLTFHSSNASVDWGNAQFQVYMTETSDTTLSAFGDYSGMTQVMTTASLSINDNIMEVTLTTPYQYQGSNLMIAFDQPTTGDYITSYWYGVQATGASFGGYGSDVSQQNFLPKMTISYLPGQAPACPAPVVAIDSVVGRTVWFHWTSTSDSVYLTLLNSEGVQMWGQFTVPSGSTGAAGFYLPEQYFPMGYTYLYGLGLCGSDTSNWALAYIPISCDAENQCPVTFVLNDGYGDGWTGGELLIYDSISGMTCANMAANNHGLNQTPTSDTVAYNLCTDRTYMVYFNRGQYSDEVSFQILDNNGNVLWTQAQGSIDSESENSGDTLGYFHLGPCASAETVCWPMGWVIGDENSSTTANGYPVNNYYRYTLTETIIDQAEIGGAMPINGIRYYYNYATPMTAKVNCTIWLQPTTKTVFSSSSDLELLDSNTAVMVYTGDLNCSQGWNTFTFDTPYQYNGTGNLMVIVDDNSNNYNTSSCVFRTSSCTGYKSLQWYSDSYNPDPTLSTFDGTKTYVQSRVVLALVTCDTSSCHDPINAVASAVGVNTATVTWSGIEPNYSVTLMSGTNVVSYSTTTDTTMAFTGLTANTDYSVVIRALCSASDSSNTVTATFHTECDLMTTLPYSYGFEGTTTGGNTNPIFDADCWKRLNNGTQYFGYPYISSTYHNGSRSTYWYGSTTTGTYGDYQVAILPGLGGNYVMSDLRLRFWAKATSASYRPVFYVGVMTDPTDISTFVYVDTVNVNTDGNTDWKEYFSLLANYTGTGRYVAIRANRPTSAWYAYIDDVVLEEAPSCLEVSNLVASAITNSSVTLTWADLQNGNGTTYTVSDAQGTTIASGLTAMTYTVTGLTANTDYTFNVLANCSATDASPATSVIAHTECDLMTTLPYTYGFEGATTGSSSNATFAAPCWHRLNNASNASYIGYPYISSSSTYCHTGSRGLYWYRATTTAYGDYQILVLPGVGGTYDISGLRVKFWAKASTASYRPVFYIGVMTDPTDASTFTYVDTVNVNTDGNTNWNEYTGNLTGYTGNGRYVAIRANRVGTSTAWYAYFDDVTLEEAPACLDVTNLAATATHNSVTLTWSDLLNSNATYTIYNGSTAVASGITGTTYTVTGLSSLTDYTLGVVANCSATEASTMTTIAVQTACAPLTAASLPFVENFDTYTSSTTDATGVQVPCWTLAHQDVTMTDAQKPQIYYSSTASYNHSGNYTLRLYYRGIYAMREIDTNISALRMSFWVRQSSSAYQLVVGVMSDLSDATTFVPVDTIDNGINTTMMAEHTVYFNNYTGNGRYIAFRNISPNTSYNYSYNYIDDVTVELIPSCMDVTNLTASNVTTNSVTLTWTDANNTGATYTVYNGIAAVATGITGTTYTVTGLTPNTDYTLGVVANCSATDASPIVNITTRTECDLMTTLPYTYGFEGTTTGTSTSPVFGPECWHRLNNGTQYMGYPYINSTYHTGTRSAYWYSSTSTSANYGTYQAIVLPGVGGNYVMNNLRLKFWSKVTTATYRPVFYVGVMADPTDYTTFVPTDTIYVNTEGNTNWDEYIAYLTNYNGNGRYVAIAAQRPATSAWYAYTDDFTLEELPSCFEVTNLSATKTNNSITLSWADNLNTSATYTVSDAQGTTIQSGITGTTYTVTGLTANTSYTYNVTANCSATDASNATSITVTTDCDAETFPFTEDFSANLSSNVCWRGATGISAAQVFAGTPLTLTTPQWTYASSARDGLAAGHYYKNVYGNGNSQLCWMITPNIDLSNAATAQLEFDVALTDYSNAALPDANGDTNTSQAFMVIISTDGGNTWSASNATIWQNASRTDMGEFSYASLASTTYLHKTISLNQYVGGTVKIAFYTQSLWSGGDNDLHLDNIAVTGDTLTPECWPMPLVIGNENSTTTSYNTPVNNYYNYTLSETIIDEAEIGGAMPIMGIKYYFNYASPMTSKTNCTIYLQPTTKTAFSSSSDLEMLSDNAVMVYTGDLNCSQGWNEFTFDTPYQYDGTSNLMVIVDDNSGSYNTNSHVFRTSACTGYKTLYWYSDSYNPDPTTSTFSGSKSYLQSRVVMALVTCDTATCHAPVVAEATTVGANNATVAWTSSNAAAYSVTLMSGSSVVSYNTTVDTTYTFTGLTANSDYSVEIRALCSATDSSASITAAFHTECDMLATLPYTYGFEGATTGGSSNAVFTAECWKRLNNCTGSYNYPYVTSSNYHAGTRSLYWYSGTSTTATYGNYQIAVLPGVGGNYDMSGLRLKFWSKVTTTSYRPVFYVGVMTDPTDYTTFVPTDTIAVNTEGNTNYAEYIAYLTNYNGNGRYVAIAAQRPATSTWYAYIDDVTLEELPSCLEPTITDVTYAPYNNGEGDYSASVTWNNTGALSYEICWNEPDTTRIIASGTDTVHGFVIHPEYVSYVKIRAICGNGDTSAWSDSVRLYYGYCTPTPTSIDGSGITNVTFGSGNEIVNNSQRPTSAPYYGNYANQIGSVPAGTTANVDITYATGFDYGTIIWVDWNKNYAFEGDEVVYVGVAPATNPTTLNASFTIPATQDTGLYRMRIAGADSYYDSYTSSIAAAANANPCPNSSYTIVHDYSLRVTEAPACMPVTSLVASVVTDSSVTLTWTDADNTGATYTVYNDTTAVATGITGTTYTINGLSALTDYTFGVVANCSSTDVSPMVTIAARTLVAPILCNGEAPLTFANADNMTGTTQYFPGYSYYNYSYSEVIVPSTQLLGLGEVKGMEFYVNSIASGSSYFNNCEVYLMNTSATSLTNSFIQDAANFQLVYSGDLNQTDTGWYLITFTNTFQYDGVSNLLVAVRRNHGTYQSSGTFGSFTSTDTLARYIYQDNGAYTIGSITGGTAVTNVPVYHMIGCEGVIPSCLPVTSVTVSNIENTSATITWDSTGAASYAVELTTATNTTTSTTSMAFLQLSQLTPATAYSVRVRAICEAGDSSTWTNPVTFTTAICPSTDQCPITVVMNDGYGDGWNGGALVIYDSLTNIAVATLSAIPGSNPGGDEPIGDNTPTSDTVLVNLCHDRTYWVSYTSGQYDDEVSYTIFANNGDTIANVSYPNAGYQVAFSHSCSSTDSIASLPYACDFEFEGDNGWVMENGTQVNWWMVGNATNNGGSQSLYITNDSSSNAYSVGTAAYVFATRLVRITEPGTYAYSFDWKAYGESSYDFIRAALVPASTAITAGSYSGFNNTSGVPTGGIAIDGAYRLNLVSSWQTQVGEITVTDTGLYKIVFMWRNDPSSGTQPPAAIDNVMLRQANCPMPQNVVASPTHNSITLTWTPAGNETSWEVSCGNTVQTVNTASYTFTGLTANTDYTVGVRALCSANESSLTVSQTVHTSCDLMTTLPYTYGFEGDATGTNTGATFAAECWRRLNNGTQYFGYPYISSTASYCHTGTRSTYWYVTTTTGTYGDYQCLVLPGVNTTTYPINTLRLKFWAKGSAATARNFLVGVMTNPTDINTFTTVDTVTVNSNDWVEHTVVLDNYTGTGAYVAIRQNRATSSYTTYIDDITLEVAPTCVEPANVTVDSITTNSALVAWTGTANAYSVAYGTGTNPDSMSTVSATGNSTMITGLTPNTAYNVYVKAICSATDQSPWTNATIFRTNCVALTANDLPYFENFDNYTTSTTAATGVQVPCWTLAHQDVSMTVAQQPQIYYSSTASYNHSGNYTLRLYYRGIYALPEITANINTLRMNFWVRQTTAAYKVIVGVMSDLNDATTFVPIDTIDNGSNTSTMAEHTVNFSSYTGNGHYIAFRNIHTSYDYSYNYIDDVTVEFLPSCQEVTALAVAGATNNSITLSWTDAANTNATYTVYNDTTTVATGITGTTYTVTGLTANTDYTFYVEANCSATSASTAVSVAAHTMCNSFTLPFTEGFETGTLSSCWSTDGSGSWSVGTGDYTLATGAHTGTYNAKITHSSTGNNTKLITPVIDFTGVATAELRFWHIQRSWSGDQDELTVYYRTSSSGTWQTLAAYTNEVSTWTEEVITLPNLSSTYQVAFEMYDGYGYGVAIDDITIDLPPACAAVTALTATPTDNSVALTWSDANTSATYTVYNMSDSTVVATGLTDTSYTVTGLTANTLYTFGVVANCSATDASQFTTVNVRTNCSAFTVPYTWTFEDMDVNAAPLCWAKVGSGTTNVLSSTSNSHNSSKYLRFSGSTSNLIVLPEIADTISNLQMRLWTRPESTSNSSCGTFSVGYVTDASDDTTFVALDTYNYNDFTGYDEKTVRFNNAPTGARMALRHTPNSTSWYWYVDDVTVEEIPSCMPVTGVAVTEATFNTVGLIWNSVAGAASYTVYNMADTSVVAANVTDTVYTVTGLTAETNYLFGVLTNCSATSSAPYPVTVDAFTGYCQPNPTSVDGSGITSVAFGSLTNDAARPSTAGYRNYSSMSGTVATGSPVTVDITYATGYDYGTIIWVDWDNSITFDSNEVVYVGTSTSTNPTTLTATFDIPADQALGSYRMRILGADSYFDNYTGSIAAAAGANPCATYSWGVAEDYTLTLVVPSACPNVTGVAVTGVTNSSVSLEWNSVASATYTLYNDTAVVATGITDTFYTVTGLTANTAYTFGVEANCSATSASAYPATVSARTLCNSVNVPFVESFEATSATRDCWTLDYPAANNAISFVTFDNHTALRFSSYASATDYNQYAYSPVINTPTEGDSLRVRVRYATNGNSDSLWFGMRMANSNDFLWDAGHVTSGQNDISYFEAILPINTVQLAIHYYGNYAYYAWIDSVEVYSYTPCQPTNSFDTVVACDSLVWNGTTYTATGNYTYTTLNAAGCDSTVYLNLTINSSTNSVDSITAFDSYTWNNVIYTQSGVYTFTTTNANGCDSIATLVLTINASPVYDTVTLAVNDTTMGSVRGAGIYDEGDTVTLYAIANTGYHFVMWSDGDTNAIRTLVLTNSISLTANFAINQYTIALTVNDSTMGVVRGAGIYNYGDTAVVTAVPNAGHHFVNWNDNDTNALRTIIVTEDVALTANFAVNQYTITVTANDSTMGSVTGSGVYNFGATATLTATADSGFHFQRWSDGNVSNPRSVVVTGDMAFTAYFVIDSVPPVQTYTVTLAANDSTMGSVFGAGVYMSGSQIEISAIANYGYHFTMWNDNDTNNPRTLTVTSDTALTANFAVNQYTVTLAVNNTTMGSVTGAGTYNYGATATLTAIANYGYHFTMWSDGDTNAQRTVTVTDNMNLTANFAVNQYTVTLAANNTLMGSVRGAGIYNYGDTVTLYAMATTGHHFVMWNDGDTNAIRTVIINNNVNLTANFAINQYTIALTVNDSTMGTVRGAGIYNYGDTAALSAIAYTGYHFVNWSDNDTNALRTIVVANDMALTANFAINQYTITVAANDSTMGSVTGSGLYNYGATATLTATADSGYHFQNWNDGNVENPRSVVVTNDANYTAIFVIDSVPPVQTYTVTLAVNDSTMGSVTGAGVYVSGSQIAISAIANYGYHFTMWNDNDTNNPRTLTVTSDTALTATFAVNQYTVTLAVNDTTMGSVTGAGVYNYGDTATLTATANNGYYFTMWSDGDTNAMRSVVVTYDINMTAIFDIIPVVPADSVTFIVAVNDSAMGTTVPAPGIYRFAVGDSASVQAVAFTGYHFANWSLANGNYSQTLSTNPLTTVVDQMMANQTFTLTANFTSDSIIPADSVTVILTINDTARGYTNPVPGTYRFAVGDTVYAAANAYTGYRFLGWSIMGAPTMVTENPIRMVVPAEVANMTINITANFVPMDDNYYNVVATPITTDGDINAGGTITGNGTYPAGSNVTLTAMPDEGYRFVGWYASTDTTFEMPISTDHSYSFVIMENTNMWALFTPESNPTAIISIATADSTMGYVLLNNDTVLRYVGQLGEEVTIEAIAYEGYRFVAWSDGDSNALRTITLDMPVTMLTARFEVITTGIDDAEEAEEIVIYTENDRITVRGAENRPVYVFDIVGRLVAKSDKATAEQTFQMTNTGIYMVKVGNAPARRVVVRR